MSEPQQKLTVYYLLNGNVKTDVRTGVNFRWTPHCHGPLDVFERDAAQHLVWTKCYIQPISAEMEEVRA